VIWKCFFADCEETVEFRFVRNEEKMEFRNVVEGVRIVRFDLHSGVRRSGSSTSRKMKQS